MTTSSPTQIHSKVYPEVTIVMSSTNDSNTNNNNVVIPMEDINGGRASSVSSKRNLGSLTWSNVSYSVSQKKNQDKILLDGLSGEVKAGQVVAIMGGSGAGKSTLLNTLAGRIGPGKLSGEILLNGKPRDKASWRLACSYVEQDDVMFANLSVYETLMYSALLRLPSSMPYKEKVSRVEKIIADLGLQSCRDTYIGDSENKGISGGERKRVAIGVELVTEPQLLFLDEPTSGLDAFNAFNIISQIKDLAVKEGKIVLMTIHQPRTDILELFDKIILLSAGKCLWFGTTNDALDHFSSLGYPIPPKTNPSDFFLDIITVDQRSDELLQKSLARINLFFDEYEKRRKTEESSSPIGKGSPVGQDGIGGIFSGTIGWPSTWAGEFWTLLRRNMQDVMRDKATLGATLGQGIFLMLLIGFIFFKVSNDAGGVQNRIGVFFFLAINQTFGTVMPTLAVFPIHRMIIKRERAAGSYRSSSAFLAKVVSSLPLTFTGALLLALPVYWMVGLQNSVTKFFTFVCIIVVHSFVANCMGLMIGSFVPSVRVGQIIGPLIIVIFLLFGGQLLNLDQVPQVFRWIQWISIVAYTNKALNQNEFDANLQFTCSPTGGPCYKDGLTVIDQFKIGTPELWTCVYINLGIAVFFLMMGYAFFNRTSAPLLKLK